MMADDIILGLADQDRKRLMRLAEIR
ncbi:hypothetical protein FAIPA1_170003 [Frankia sp. AiPs1]